MSRLRMLAATATVAATALLTAAGVSAATATPWAPNTTYATGALVSYDGLTYNCIQGHTSLTGWEPPNVPALWGQV